MKKILGVNVNSALYDLDLQNIQDFTPYLIFFKCITHFYFFDFIFVGLWKIL